jgi:AraC-like DNA-binding protein/quercetin dioxygenase-like cupin family protein
MKMPSSPARPTKQNVQLRTQVAKMEAPLIRSLGKFVFEDIAGGRVFDPAHLHSFHQFEFMLSGRISAVLEPGASVHLRRGDGVLMPPLVRHGYRTTGGYRKGVFKFHVSPQYWPLLGMRVRKVRLSPELLAHLEAWARRYESGEALLQQESVALASLCLIETIRDTGDRPRGPDGLDAFRQKLWPVLERIANDPHAGWTVAQLAGECNLSTDRFSRLFHRVIGYPPQDHLFHARMQDVAAQLISQPTRPIKEIAERARYGSVHSFTHAFKDAFGASPAAYRRLPA